MNSFVDSIRQIFAIPSKPYAHGFWGKPTSTVDWCEINYSWTFYIAEFFNTFSSLAMVVVGLIGLALHWRHFEKSIRFMFSSIAVVGIGSAAFHGTLLFGLQMLDELPMIYTALIMTYVMIQLPHKQPKYKPHLPILMVCHAIFTTILVASPAISPAYASPTLQFVSFHLSFAALEIFLFVKAFQLWKGEKDPVMRQLNLTGCLLWLAGITCWVLDYAGCDYLWEGPDSFRSKFLTFEFGQMAITLPNPQLHAWWHICASSGLYFMSIGAAKKRMDVLGFKTSINLYFRVIPHVHVKLVASASKNGKNQLTQPTESEANVLYSDRLNAQPRRRVRSAGR